MEKLILVILDGCTYAGAQENMGFMEHMAETGQCAKYRVCGELPSMSRPMYETLLTGLPVCEHLITSNTTVRRSKEESLFTLCTAAGKRTAAAAYYWMSELYSSAPFVPDDRFQLDHKDALIQNGLFYFEDDYPDSHLFCDGEFLRRFCNPDFLLIHSMNIDDAGHKFGSQSLEYASKISKADTLLAMCLPEWQRDGYNVMVTADHGMGAQGLHGGNTEMQREVALYLFSDTVRKEDFTAQPVSQLAVAPLACALLGLRPAQKMKKIAEFGVDFFEKATD